MLRDHVPVPTGAGRRGLCVRVLEAFAESHSRDRSSQALARLDSLHRTGTGFEAPHGAHLALARLWEARGDSVLALAAVRRRHNGWHQSVTTYTLAALREEGQLAAHVGDTAGAIWAYRRYLTLRDLPDPGPMAEEVNRVKAHLALLLARTGRQPSRDQVARKN
jgi:hypothetical protein